MNQQVYDRNACLPVSPSHSHLLSVDEQLAWGEVMRRMAGGRVESVDGILGVNTTSTSMSAKDSSLRVLPQEKIKKAVKSLVSKGLLFTIRKKGKRTFLCAMSPLNMFLMEKFGLYYFKYLQPHSCSMCEGMVVNRSLIDWSLRSGDDETFAQMYPTVYNDKKTAFNNSDMDALLTRVYSLGSREPSSVPMGIRNILLLNNIYTLDTLIPEELRPFGAYLAIATEPIEKAEEIMKSLLFGVEFAESTLKSEMPEVDGDGLKEEKKEEQKPSLRMEASEDYKKFCLYLQSGELLKKKTEEWVAKDFIVYIYCGMARWSQPPFPIPDFPKECTQIKRVMTSLGNKKLREIIFFLVKNYPDITQTWATRDYTISVPTFCTGWKLEKLARMLDAEKKHMDESKTLKDFKRSEAEAAKVSLEQHNTQVGSLVEEMREQFINKEKEDVQEKSVPATVA